LVLADEPTANLDSKMSEQIIDLLLRLNHEHGVTFLISTHDTRVTERARRAVRIANGKVVSEESEAAA
jgi:putative ABC transport system ATP-binding protein